MVRRCRDGHYICGPPAGTGVTLAMLLIRSAPRRLVAAAIVAFFSLGCAGLEASSHQVESAHVENSHLLQVGEHATVVYAHDFVVSGTGSLTDPWVGKDGAGGIRDAIASVPEAKAVHVVCSKGVYEISHVLQLRANSSVAGAGMNDTVLLHTPFTRYGSFGSMAAGSGLRDLTMDGNRWAPTSAGLCVGGMRLDGAAISVMSVRVQNFGCAAFSPTQDADGLSITDCVSVDSHYFVWAEATCGYASHRYLRNQVFTTRPDPKNRSNAFELDNGNGDGLLNCTIPTTASERLARRNVLANNTIVNFMWQGIAIARMRGFELVDNTILSGELSIPGGNGIHIEHDSGDILVQGNTVTQPVSEPIWISASGNITVVGNTVSMANCTKDCVQVCTQPHDETAPLGPLAGTGGMMISGNTLSGCRAGINVWGSGTAGLTGVPTPYNIILCNASASNFAAVSLCVLLCACLTATCKTNQQNSVRTSFALNAHLMFLRYVDTHIYNYTHQCCTDP